MGEPALRYRVRYHGDRPDGWPDEVLLYVPPRERVTIDVPTAAGVRRTVVIDLTTYAFDPTKLQASKEDAYRVAYAGEIVLHAVVAMTPLAWAVATKAVPQASRDAAGVSLDRAMLLFLHTWGLMGLSLKVVKNLVRDAEGDDAYVAKVDAWYRAYGYARKNQGA